MWIFIAKIVFVALLIIQYAHVVYMVSNDKDATKNFWIYLFLLFPLLPYYAAVVGSIGQELTAKWKFRRSK